MSSQEAVDEMQARPASRRARFRKTLAALGRPRVLVMLLLGFSSGLPFMLTGNTLGYWLREGGLSLSAIGFLSWVGLAYFFKFLWAPLIDRLDAPLLGRLGRRRGWMLLSQVLVGAALVAMGLIGPQGGLAALGLAAVVVAFASATQDIVVDAWRIEAAQDSEEQGLMTSAYQLGYRAALLCADALILILAQYAGWPASYVLFGLAMSIGLWATLKANEPQQADAVMRERAAEAPLLSLKGVFDAIAGPFIAFFGTHRWFAAVMLLTITFYHLSDYMRGPISNPFYHDAGYSKAMVGAIRATAGLWATIGGVAAGGLCSMRLGFFRTLILGAVLQPIGILGFAGVALAGGPNPALFTAVMSLDNFAIGFSGVALVAYMSSLMNLGYAAGQYALLSSALNFAGKTLKGFSGLIIETLQHGRTLMEAYAAFYAAAAAIGLPAVALCLVLARQAKIKARAAVSGARPPR